MGRAEHDNISVVVFVLSLLIAIVALRGDDESAELALAARALAVVIGCGLRVKKKNLETP